MLSPTLISYLRLAYWQRSDEAVEALERAAELLPDSWVVFGALGNAHHMVDCGTPCVERAVAAYERAHVLNPVDMTIIRYVGGCGLLICGLGIGAYCGGLSLD